MQDLRFFPESADFDIAQQEGFRIGEKGTHGSRTMMSAELTALLASVSPAPTRAEIVEAIVTVNCLGKATTATRRTSLQRLSELYALNPANALFRILVRLWPLNSESRPLLALLCALARDPLLRASAGPILRMLPAAELPRAELAQALRDSTGDRLSEAVLDKVVRNVSSSWAQSGHLSGRTFKKRQSVKVTPATCAFALYLATTAGFSSTDAFASAWCAVLDLTPSEARDLALDAKRLGLIDVRSAGDIVELGFARLDPRQAARY